MEPTRLRAALGDWAVPHRPLYAALAEALRTAVAEGTLPAGSRLPAERRLAAELSVSRGTVVAAYDDLRAEGLVRTRHGSGTVVATGASPFTGPREAELAAVLGGASLVSALTEPPGPGTIDLRTACWVGAEDLPADLFDLGGAQLGALLTGHGYHPAGRPDLRAAVADLFTDEGVPTAPEQVLVTSGAQQALFLLGQLLLGEGDLALVEALTYPTALASFTATGAQVATVPLGAEGVDVDRLLHAVDQGRPRLAYLMPGMHNPTGRVLPAHAARRLAEAAERWDTVVVDDRALAPLWFDDAPPPPLAAHAPDAARLVTVGSLSKWTWGGLRVGWVRASRAMIDRLARLKAHDDLGAAAASQLIATRLLARADEVAATRRTTARARYLAMADALARHLPTWSWTPPQGGLCLWVDLPEGDSLDLVALAARRDVAIAPGTVSLATGTGGSAHLRLPFGLPVTQIEAGVIRLAEAWDEHLDRRHHARPVGALR